MLAYTGSSAQQALATYSTVLKQQIFARFRHLGLHGPFTAVPANLVTLQLVSVLGMYDDDIGGITFIEAAYHRRWAETLFRTQPRKRTQLADSDLFELISPNVTAQLVIQQNAAGRSLHRCVPHTVVRRLDILQDSLQARRWPSPDDLMVELVLETAAAMQPVMTPDFDIGVVRLPDD